LATARGIPTVVTAVGALPGLVPSSDFIVPPGDAVALAAAIEAAVDAPIDVREQFRQHAASRISWAAVSRRSISLYRSVVTP
jgi:glycosyltransferase involved in cell wall biosynthesis